MGSLKGLIVIQRLRQKLEFFKTKKLSPLSINLSSTSYSILYRMRSRFNIISSIALTSNREGILLIASIHVKQNNTIVSLVNVGRIYIQDLNKSDKI